MPNHAQLPSGTLDLLILRAISLGPLHGYGVLLRIEHGWNRLAGSHCFCSRAQPEEI